MSSRWLAIVGVRVIAVAIVVTVVAACAQRGGKSEKRTERPKSSDPDATPKNSSPSLSVVEKFQTQWNAIDTPKLTHARNYWNNRVADAANLFVSEHQTESVFIELTALAPEELRHLALFGSVDALRKDGKCKKVVVRGEREGGLPQIVAYLDSRSGKLLLVLFYR
jgi:hypothetical protein